MVVGCGVPAPVKPTSARCWPRWPCCPPPGPRWNRWKRRFCAPREHKACRGRGSPARWDWSPPRRRSSHSAGGPAESRTGGEVTDVTHLSAAEDLALHGVRVLGFPTAARVAARYGLDVGTVEAALLDFEAWGWVGRSSFAGRSGWSLTDAGRTENERRM